MERRFEERKKAMMVECEVDPGVFSGMIGRLRSFARPFIERLFRQEQKDHAQTYISGLLSDLERKNTESIAYRHDEDRRGLQHFIGESHWDGEPLLAELAQQVGKEIGEPDGVIVFDPSGFQKKGKESVGVARQWLGRLGKTENGQVAVYMGYVSREGHALVDERLYLPKDWAKDKKRRRKCGVPKEIRFLTRHELALEMLDKQGGCLPHEWVAGDDEMGRSTAFRRTLRQRQEHYLLAIPSNIKVRDLDAAVPSYGGRGARPKQSFQNVRQWRESLKDSDWVRIHVRDGEKGPLVVEMAKTRVQPQTERSRRGPPIEELLVVTRCLDEEGKAKHDYYLSNANPDTPYEDLARVAKAEHRIEECIKRGKSEAGLADYEVRTWHGWHHHQTLSLIATWFLIVEERRGKKGCPCHHRAADQRGTGEDAAQRLPMREPG